jgi:hypothetical protein
MPFIGTGNIIFSGFLKNTGFQVLHFRTAQTILLAITPADCETDDVATE